MGIGQTSPGGQDALGRCLGIKNVRRLGCPRMKPNRSLTAENHAMADLPRAQIRLLQTRIAELEAANQHLRHSEWRYRQIFENAPISMMFFNRDGYLTEINAAAEDLYGLPIEEFNRPLAN